MSYAPAPQVQQTRRGQVVLNPSTGQQSAPQELIVDYHSSQAAAFHAAGVHAPHQAKVSVTFISRVIRKNVDQVPYKKGQY